MLKRKNVVAQELRAHGFELYYFNSKKQGELDFVIEKDGKVLPIEVKSGKDYQRHNALSNVMLNPDYDIEAAVVVLSGGNVSIEGRVLYLPVYMTCFIEKEKMSDMYYSIDVGALAASYES